MSPFVLSLKDKDKNWILKYFKITHFEKEFKPTHKFVILCNTKWVVTLLCPSLETIFTNKFDVFVTLWRCKMWKWLNLKLRIYPSLCDWNKECLSLLDKRIILMVSDNHRRAVITTTAVRHTNRSSKPVEPIQSHPTQGPGFKLRTLTQGTRDFFLGATRAWAYNLKVGPRIFLKTTTVANQHTLNQYFGHVWKFGGH